MYLTARLTLIGSGVNVESIVVNPLKVADLSLFAAEQC